MLTNFEDITENLTSDELQLANIILTQLKNRYNTKSLAIKQDEIVGRMKERGYKISGPRLRKIFNYLRSQGNPIIAVSSGCFYSTNREEIISQIKSLEDRQKALDAPISGLKKLLNS